MAPPPPPPPPRTPPPTQASKQGKASQANRHKDRNTRATDKMICQLAWGGEPGKPHFPHEPIMMSFFEALGTNPKDNRDKRVTSTLALRGSLEETDLPDLSRGATVGGRSPFRTAVQQTEMIRFPNVHSKKRYGFHHGF